ncbi:BTAD domain-containing putative transcriptional regulator [Paractinoplanes rhizophilus]|uniref:BTAD domain-containing putative transcriptional regulator n=1 Tax=Paractinoplanes rhizophilus TaxID=1416877 RepID=A0ABW2HTP0_9ACTN
MADAVGGDVIEFRLLGPIEVRAGGRPVDAGQPRQRAVLAVLAADAGRAVPVEAMIDRVWGDAPPRGARASLQAHVTRIRQALGEVPLTFAAGCYTLGTDPLSVDLHRLRHLTAQARDPRAGDASRLRLLREAVRLWRGEPLAGLRGPWVAQCRQAWGQEHLAAAVAWGEAELRAGDPAAAVTTLADLAAEHPLTESLAAVLMRSLAAAGRPAEALAHYETVRRRLVEDLGADPSPELQEAHRSILRGPDPVAGPAQLPADVFGFTGRADQLAQLEAVLPAAPGAPGDGPGPAGAVGIAVVSGMAGVGKSALAVHWAHTVAGRFPDGQLYVNLRGFDPAGRVMDPADAVRGFLGALGVARDKVPSGLDAQAALYRSLLAGKRILVLLDNARDAEHVRPLLPATAGAVAVVTSRNRLTGLLAAEGARPVALDVLSDEEARDLLARRLGADRTAAEPEAVDEIVEACARLPLALAITAARAQLSGFPLRRFAAELRESGVDALDTGDPALQVRAVFDCSYAALSEPAARLFRLLGAHPGPDIGIAAAAALAGQQARRELAELVNANLLTEHLPGRYVLHDLLRAYAAGLSEQRGPAIRRLLDHYAHTAHAADRLLYPARDPMEISLGDGKPAPLADHRAAMEWLAAEHRVLLAAARYAAGNGFDAYAWQLAWGLDTFLFRRGLWHEQIPLWSVAAEAAERLGNLTARAFAYRSVGRTLIAFGRHDEARAQLQRAAQLYERTGHAAGQGFIQNTLGYLLGSQKEWTAALEYDGRALAFYREAGSARGQAIALSQFGWHHDMLGNYEEAIAYCRAAIALHRQVGDRRGEADVLDSIGYAHHHLGRHEEAAESYRQAIDLVRELGDRFAEAQILVHLGDTGEASGDPAASREAWAEAVRILTELNHPDEREVRAKLDAGSRLQR